MTAPAVPERDGAALRARYDAIRQLQGWLLVRETHELMREIDRGEWDGTVQQQNQR